MGKGGNGERRLPSGDRSSRIEERRKRRRQTDRHREEKGEMGGGQVIGSALSDYGLGSIPQEEASTNG